MSPLQLGEPNSLFIVLAGVVLAGLIIGLAVTLMRRSSAMSDEISKQSRAKFEAIKPGPALPDHTQVAEVMEKTEPTVRTDRIQYAGGYLALRKDLQETRFQLERYIRENAPHAEKQREAIASIEKLKTEVYSLRDRLNIDGQEMQKLRTSVAEQSIKLHSQRRDIESQRSGIEKVWERPEVEKFRAEISTLKDRLRITEQELQKQRTNLEEQGVNLQQARDLEAQGTGIIEAAPPPEIMLPPVREKLETNIPQTQTPANFSLKNCLSCGSPLQPQDRYCLRCGQRVI